MRKKHYIPLSWKMDAGDRDLRVGGKLIGSVLPSADKGFRSGISFDVTKDCVEKVKTLREGKEWLLRRFRAVFFTDRNYVQVKWTRKGGTLTLSWRDFSVGEIIPHVSSDSSKSFWKVFASHGYLKTFPTLAEAKEFLLNHHKCVTL